MLKLLDIFNSSLTCVPASFRNFDSLETVSCEMSKLECLPNDLSGLKTIDCITLSCTELLHLPDSISSLRSLQYLYIAENGQLISLLPSSCLNRLEQLILGDCDALTSIPRELCTLQSLTQLRMYDCHGLISRPNKFSQLSNLEELNMCCAEAAGYPAGLENLPSLQRLEIRDQQLVPRLPLNIGYLSNLQCLNLTMDNRLEILPPTFSRLELTSLQQLCIHNRSEGLRMSMPPAIASLPPWEGCVCTSPCWL